MLQAQVQYLVRELRSHMLHGQKILIFLPAILIPVCASSSLAFLMMYSAYNLNKQGNNIEPWSTPFPIGNQSVVPCPVLTVDSWPAYRFLKRQVRWSGIPISFRILTEWHMKLKFICSCCSATQSCLTLLQPMDCSLPGSSIHGISSKNIRVGCRFLLQGIFLTQEGSNPYLLHLLHCRCILYHRAIMEALKSIRDSKLTIYL